jgi:hypothetical protein
MQPTLRTWADLLTAQRWDDVTKFCFEVVYNKGTLYSYLNETGHLVRLYKVIGNRTDYFSIPFAESVICASFSKPGEFAYNMQHYCSNEPILFFTFILGGGLFSEVDEKKNYIVDPDWDVSIPVLAVATDGRSVKLFYYNPPVDGFGVLNTTFSVVSSLISTQGEE